VLEHCATIEPTQTYIIDDELLDAFEEVRPNLNMHPSSTLYFAANRGDKPAPDGYIDLKTELDGAAVATPPHHDEDAGPGPVLLHLHFRNDREAQGSNHEKPALAGNIIGLRSRPGIEIRGHHLYSPAILPQHCFSHCLGTDSDQRPAALQR